MYIKTFLFVLLKHINSPNRTIEEIEVPVDQITPPHSHKGSISTTNWDQDTLSIPRLQIVDEHQKFT